MQYRKITKSPLLKPTLLLILTLFLITKASGQSFEEEIKAFRTKYKADFLKDENSPLEEDDLQYLDFYEANAKYKVKCKFKVKGTGEPFEIPTSSGKTKTYAVFGELSFKIDGKKQKLNVYRSLALMKNPLYKDYLFIPFKDLTSGNETYGAGRYLDLRMSDLEEEIWLDFNKAYNPYCAFSLGYSCPIPPVENHLKVRIEAGERNYLKEWH